MASGRTHAPTSPKPPEKRTWPAGTLLGPVPAVMVSCQGREGPPNIITVAWAGTLCTNPPLLGISVRPERHSFRLISETGEFVVNMPSRYEAFATDLCGVVSGRDGDKFARAGLTAAPAEHVKAPIIAECPINIECRVKQTLPLGSHTLFIAEIVGVQVTRRLISAENHLSIEKAGLLAFAHGTYFELGKAIGSFGFSVKKK